MEPHTGPDTGEQFAALAVLAAIAAQQEAAYRAEAAAIPRPRWAQASEQARYADGDQLGALLSEIDAARRRQGRHS